MKIIFAIKAMDNPGGGAERVLAAVSSALAARGHQVLLLTCDLPGGRSYYPLHPAILRIPLGIGDTTRPSTLPETLQRIVVLRRVITEQQPDMVIGFMHSMFIPLGLALSGTGIPVIASEHVVQEHYQRHPLQSLLLKMTPYITSAITVVSDQARNSYPASLRRHMVTIPNPVTIKPEASADICGGQRKILLTVGRLAAEKDHITLLQAFARIANNLPDWDLRIIGEGELRAAIESEIRALTLQDRVQMPGSNPSIYNEYLNAQLFVVSSRYESFGLATAEALAHGLPAVGFADCPGTNTLIRHGENGILVRGTDRVQALADGLKCLMSDPEKRKRYGEQAKRHMNQFDLPVVIEKWEKLLDSQRR